MTRPLTKSDLEEIDQFYAEFGDAADDELPDDEASLDTLIDQLEASFETVSSLTRHAAPASDDLRLQVQELAQRLEQIAVDLAQINQKLQ
ncbi:hypothetical protein AN191_03390 [Loktanella sp. 5RATIMAR09]|uniref:hypothetical protein n=1 Tax=Loktanella sp. 5RATIMAR09 TaxID=1225655 RepID=UPI0006EB674D|nr:hypothetical protein [Loktanella sp. 5RATIMAR09]KQI72964.1 hypothetical protein AN191_03390 [Loktanella sp. 5RATIMAR09]